MRARQAAGEENTCSVYDAHHVRFPESIFSALMSRSKNNLVADAKEIFSAAVGAVRPSRCFERLSLVDLVSQARERDETSLEAASGGLDSYDAVWIVAFGKAALGMAGAAETQVEACGGTVAGGIAVVPPGYRESLPGSERRPEKTDVMIGDHPVAGEASARAGRAVLRIVENAGENDLVLCLISGGGTSLITVPVDELDVWDVRRTYSLLLKSGANIHEVNSVRKHLTQIGGGQLAERSRAHIVSLIVSDVPGDDLSVIASGPTVPDPSTFEDTLRVAYRHGFWSDLPEPIRNRLAEGARGRRKETPDDASALRHPRHGSPVNHLIATNQTAQSAARRKAEELGYQIVSPGALLGASNNLPDAEADHQSTDAHPDGMASYLLSGEAKEVGAHVVRGWIAVDKARTTAPGASPTAGTGADTDPSGPLCCVLGGETTVTVTGDGKGGRSQELALAAAIEMDEADDEVVVLAGGTDGVDGPTEAAGAWCHSETAARIRAAGIDPEEALRKNDSFAAHEAAGSILVTGPTHTNVMDLVILLKA